MYPIHAMSAALVLRLSTVRVLPQLHVAFYTHLTIINRRDGNLVPPRYWKDMCGFIKGTKLAFMHYEKHYPSTTFIYTSDQGPTTSDNVPEP